MISKELQELCINRFNLEGHFNTNIVFLEGLYRESAFQEAYPNFTKITNFKYRDKVTGTEWAVVRACMENCRGRRIKRAIVDSRICEETFRETIIPVCAAGNCIRMEFF